MTMPETKPAVTGEPEIHAEQVRSGDRFQFGANWQRFLRLLDDRRIEIAVQSLRSMLEVDRLDGRTFLDAGSGSGLFSLAARRLRMSRMTLYRKMSKHNINRAADRQLRRDSVTAQGA